MKMTISKLYEGENRFSFSSQKDTWINDVILHVEKEGYVLKSPIQTDLSFTKLEPDFYLKGRLNFDVQQSCSRCAEDFTLHVQHPFDIALAKVHRLKVPQISALSEDSEELDVNFFEGNEIDLVPILQEQFFLSIPYQSICKDDCKGLCQTCGKNLNLISCSCKKNNLKSSFSVLQNLTL